jgi:hypothetical protein
MKLFKLQHKFFFFFTGVIGFFVSTYILYQYGWIDNPSEITFYLLFATTILISFSRMIIQPPEKIRETREKFPKRITYTEVSKHFHKDKLILGFIEQEGKTVPLYGAIEDLFCVDIIGLPGRGKSTLLYFLIAQFVRMQAKITIFDPHATLMQLKNIGNYAHNMENILKWVPLVHDEFDERQKRFEENGGECHDPYYVLVIDELAAIATHERMMRKKNRNFDSVIDLIQRIVIEGRKYRIFCFVASQAIPSTVLPTLARDNFASHYAFYSTALNARMTGFTSEQIKRFIDPLKKREAGYCAINPQRLDMHIGTIPYTTPKDVYGEVQQTVQSIQIIQTTPGKFLTGPSQKTIRGITIEEELLETIRNEVRNKNYKRRIDVLQNLKIGHKYYPVVSYLIEEEESKIQQKEEVI